MTGRIYGDLVEQTEGNDFFLREWPGTISDQPHTRGFKVEIGIPTTGSNVVGTAIVGTAIVEAPFWAGVTEDFLGADINIGNDDGSNEVSTATLTLNNETGKYSPWANAYAGPDTLVRFSSLQFDSAHAGHNVKTNLMGALNFDDHDWYYWDSITTTYNIKIGTGFTGPDSNFSFDLSGSDFIVETSSFPSISATAYLRFRIYDGSGYVFDVVRFGSGTTTLRSTDPSGTTTTGLGGYTDKWWRISEAGGTLHLWTSTDGVSWTSRNSAFKGSMDVTQVAVQLTAYAPTSEFDAAHGWKIASINRGLVRSMVEYPLYGWIPIWTGITESWVVDTPSRSGPQVATITCVDTISLLARIDDKALGSVVGGGETTLARIQRLLDAADWPYHLAIGDGVNTYTHQSTDMASNRLTECFLTADSANLVFRSDAYGRAYIGPRIDPDMIATEAFLTYNMTNLNIANDGDQIINSVSLAYTGGTETTYTDAPSISRFGVRSYKRDDLNVSSGTDLSDLANTILAIHSKVLRPISFELENQDGFDEACLTSLYLRGCAYGMEVGLVAGVPSWELPDSQVIIFDGTLFTVVRINHSIVPMGADNIRWTASYGLLAAGVEP